MTIKRILFKIAGLLAVICMVLSVVARIFCANKALFGLSALSYLRITDTMLLFAIFFWMLDKWKGKNDNIPK